jgi:hypothetical protein
MPKTIQVQFSWEELEVRSMLDGDNLILLKRPDPPNVLPDNKIAYGKLLGLKISNAIEGMPKYAMKEPFKLTADKKQQRGHVICRDHKGAKRSPVSYVVEKFKLNEPLTFSVELSCENCCGEEAIEIANLPVITVNSIAEQATDIVIPIQQRALHPVEIVVNTLSGQFGTILTKLRDLGLKSQNPAKLFAELKEGGGQQVLSAWNLAFENFIAENGEGPPHEEEIQEEVVENGEKNAEDPLATSEVPIENTPATVSDIWKIIMSKKAQKRLGETQAAASATKKRR